MHQTLASSDPSSLDPHAFAPRHLGPSEGETRGMLEALGVDSIATLIRQVVPDSIRVPALLPELQPLDETAALARLKSYAAQNRTWRTYIGQGYYPSILPPVILRNVLENPGWYTAYTPYQAEIAQGRLEALLTFQTMVTDLTGMEIANASLLDEATAAAEAVGMCAALVDNLAERPVFLASDRCHPQTLAVVRTRARAIGIEVRVGDANAFTFEPGTIGVLVQYPDTHGRVEDWSGLVGKAHAAGAKVVVATDLLALTLLRPPGEFGADIVVGSTQRFGMPLGFGGPHAAFFATRDAFKRSMPGRLIGVSKDSAGKPAMRLSLQTREQHIRRDKATSNICTAQVLPAVIATMYAVYHGPERLRTIAARIHGRTRALAAHLASAGFSLEDGPFFDTLSLRVSGQDRADILARAHQAEINLRHDDPSRIGVSLDETVGDDALNTLAAVLTGRPAALSWQPGLPEASFRRTSEYLQHPNFQTYHSETEMLRYLKRLENRDIALTHSMIALGSCTMKLNATAEMIPMTWPEFGNVHPFAPEEQWQGYRAMFDDLERWLAAVTGFQAVSLQPNAGSQGEYAGLLAIQKFHQARGEGHRDICLIPQSAHGTNFASAVMCGLKVVVTKCDDMGNVDLADLQTHIAAHRDRLSCVMVTYPSTHGVFEEEIRDICAAVHGAGGQVYMDGANMNAQVGLCSPGAIGADVCHLNLHKTFCIPHGGGGPGMGPIAVASHLAGYLPQNPVAAVDPEHQVGAVCASSHGSGCILTISWTYMALMGGSGLTRATEIAILNANYIASRLRHAYPVVFQGRQGRVAHECIIDLRQFKASAGIEVEDVAKRLIDYGFHAPTMSWPVPGTLMIEPTESEPKDELDRFCDALLAIHQEIKDIEEGRLDRKDNPLKNAPHTAEVVVSDAWNRSYSRERAAFPLPWIRERKYWPPVGRVDNVHGDRNLFCSCIYPGKE
ncbi:MAG: aminomethyl-transferring glycine dehydrogenase [Candidatus Methylacidiphilales bacterium]|nr:aminomethyl-transferring glycine dehydrogenase [Candidatus Methylacidiphilales bacterium]